MSKSTWRQPLRYHGTTLPWQETNVVFFLLYAFILDSRFAKRSNTGAAIPGIVGVALTGYILDATNSWKLVFGIAIGFYLIGTVVYNLLGTGERVF